MADPISAAIVAFAQTVGTYASSAAFAVGFSGAAASSIGVFTASALSLGMVGSGLAGTLGALVGTTAFSAGISALTAPKIPDTMAQLNAKRSSVADRTMLAGRVAVGGLLATDTMVHGKNNVLVGFVAILSGAGKSGKVEKILYGDDEVYFNPDGSAIGTYNHKIWLTQRNGSWSQSAAIQTWSGASWDQPSDWGVNDKLLGCAHALVQINAGDDKIKADGIKQPIFIFNANETPLVDPRTGAATTTQLQTENSAIWGYTWARSLFEASPSGLVIAGLGVSASGVHTASFAEAASFVDTNGFKISAEINLNPENGWENLRAIMQSGGCDVTIRNGQIYALTASPKSIVGIITDDDCVSKPTRKALTAAHQRPNRIIPRYRSEANKWEIVDGTPITDSSFVTADGGKVRTITYELPFAGGGAVPVGKLAGLALVNARELWEYSLSLKPQARYIGLVGDCVQLNISRLGWTSKKVLIGEMQSTIGLATQIKATSETDSKYPWALGQSTTPPDQYANTRYDASQVPQPESGKWTAAAVNITNGGTSLPIIRITGDALDFTDCTGVVIEYKPNSGSVWQMAGDLPKTSTSIEINEVTPDTEYNVRVTYKGKGGFFGSPRSLSNVTTGTLVAGASADGAAANSAISAINDVNILTKDKKPQVIRDWNTIQAEYATSNWVSTATSLGISTEVANYQNAYIALSNYLNSLTVSGGGPNNWYDTSVNTAITRATWDTKWRDYDTTKLALQAKINAVQVSASMAINGVRDSQQTQGLKFRGLTWDTIPQTPTLVEATDATLGKFSQLKTPAIAALGSGNYYGLSQHMAVDAVNGVRLAAGRVGYSCGVSVSDASKWNRVWLRCYIWNNDGNWVSISEVDYNLSQGGTQELSTWFDSGVSCRYSLVVWGQLKATVNTEQELNSWRPMICQMAAGQSKVPNWTPSNDTEPGADVTLNAQITPSGATSTIFDFLGGSPVSGQLPRTIQARAFKGGTEITASGTWSITNAINCTVSVSNVSGLNGQETISALSGTGNVERSYVRQFTYNGVLAFQNKVTIGYNNTDTVASQSKAGVPRFFNATINSTGWVNPATTGLMTINDCPSNGIINISGYIQFDEPTLDYTATVRLKIDGTVVYTSAAKTVCVAGVPVDADFSDVFMYVNSTPLSSGTHTFAIEAQRTSGTGTASAVGNLSITITGS